MNCMSLTGDMAFVPMCRLTHCFDALCSFALASLRRQKGKGMGGEMGWVSKGEGRGLVVVVVMVGGKGMVTSDALGAFFLP
jgi:hypothetical protein